MRSRNALATIFFDPVPSPIARFLADAQRQIGAFVTVDIVLCHVVRCQFRCQLPRLTVHMLVGHVRFSAASGTMVPRQLTLTSRFELLAGVPTALALAGAFWARL